MKKELTNISEKSLMELEDIVNEEMLTSEDVNNMLEHTDKGRIKQTIRNCVTVLQNDPVLKKAIKRNELSGRMDIVKEVPWERRNNSPIVIYFGEWIKSVIPINLIVLLLLVHVVYIGIRCYVKDWQEERGYY